MRSFADALFRQARQAAPAWNLGKTLVQVAAFWFTFLVLIPRALVTLEHRLGVARMPSPLPDELVWSLLVAASALGLWSGALMAVRGAGTPLPLDAPRRLVVTGPYRYVRNPMAVAGLTQGACVALLLDSWLSLAFVFAGGIVWNWVVRPLEEHHLESVFGDEFRDYRQAVRCWIPRA